MTPTPIVPHTPPTTPPPTLPTHLTTTSDLTALEMIRRHHHLMNELLLVPPPLFTARKCMIAEAILRRVPSHPRIPLPVAGLRGRSAEEILQLLELRDGVEQFVAEARAALVVKVRLYKEVRELLAGL